MTDRKGDWILTAGGRQFWPLDPRAEEVCIEDIAAALSLQCRYGGHCRWHYSVAQHSVYVSYQVPAQHALAGLLHDATEAYCVDVPRPLKASLHGYAEIEAGLWRVIAARFGLAEELPDCVHDADGAVLLAEKAQIMPPSPADWAHQGRGLVAPTAAPVTIGYWTPEQARKAFLRRFHELAGGV